MQTYAVISGTEIEQIKALVSYADHINFQSKL